MTSVLPIIILIAACIILLPVMNWRMKSMTNYMEDLTGKSYDELTGYRASPEEKAKIQKKASSSRRKKKKRN